MRQWLTLLQKEMLEMWRNFKILWVPLTFILLGIDEPISSYYLPQIINSVGGLPEGAVIKIPTPTAAEVLIKGLSQYTSIGVLILILTTMGLLAGERKSGVAAMILVKPVSYRSFVTAKWAGGMILMLSSFLLGYLATWYYTGVLFKWISIGAFFQSSLFYALWFTFVLTVALFFSAVFLSPGMAGFVSIGVVMLISLISSSFSRWLQWSPAQLTDQANQLLLSGELPKHLFASSVLTVLCIVFILIGSIFIFKNKELAGHNG